AFDVELAEGRELVTKELSPKRAPPPRREAVQDAAAKTELTADLHQGLAPVAESDQTAQQVIECVGLARCEREAPLLEGLYAQRRPGDRGPGGEGDQRVAGRHRIEGLQPSPHGFLVRCEPIKRERLNGGKNDSPDILPEPGAGFLEGSLRIRHQ